MKRKQILIVLALLIFTITSKQLDAQPSPHLWIGGFAGVDQGKISISVREKELDGTTFKTGLAVGGEFDYFFSDNFAVSAQIAYVQKGGNRSFDQGSGSWGYDLSYLQIPVLLRVTVGSGDLKPFFFAGPEFGIKLSTKLRAKNESGTDTTFNFPDNLFTTSTLGLMFGAGVTYAINPATMLFISGAYDLGLTNLNAQFGNNTPFSSDDDIYYSRDFRINVGILFGIGKGE